MKRVVLILVAILTASALPIAQDAGGFAPTICAVTHPFGLNNCLAFRD